MLNQALGRHAPSIDGPEGSAENSTFPRRELLTLNLSHVEQCAFPVRSDWLVDVSPWSIERIARSGACVPGALCLLSAALGTSRPGQSIPCRAGRHRADCSVVVRQWVSLRVVRQWLTVLISSIVMVQGSCFIIHEVYEMILLIIQTT